jgi:hypothetical protein
VIEKEKERHVTRLGPDMTGLMTRLVTRSASDVGLRGNPLLQGPLPPLSARPAAPEPIPHPQVRATRGVVCAGVVREGRGREVGSESRERRIQTEARAERSATRRKTIILKGDYF